LVTTVIARLSILAWARIEWRRGGVIVNASAWGALATFVYSYLIHILFFTVIH
jgi:hypothetical protein